METLIYLGKVNCCWILFYGCYWLLFRKHTFFRWNRAYLLGSLMVSFAFPLVTFSEPLQVVPEVIYSISPTRTLAFTTQVPENTIPWMEISGLVYLAGTLVMFFRLLRGFFDLGSIILRSERIPMQDYTLVLLPKTISGSFSFFRWLAVSDEDYQYHLDTILCHETVHVRQWHSIDILFIELLKTFFWFNPALWFYKKSFQEVHEFLADEQAPNKERYATFLVSYALNSPVQSLTNHFFNSSLLKSRIKMIYKNRTSRWLLGKYAIILPVAAVLVSLTAARERLLEAQPVLSVKAASVTAGEVSEKTKPNKAAALSFNPALSETEEHISIKGIINDSKGTAVKNATIVVKNTKIGTKSDQDGTFTLSNVPVNGQVVVSHVSYKSVALDIDKAKTDYQIELTPASILTSEVVVVSYIPINTSEPSAEQKSKSDTDKSEFVIVEQNAEFPGGEREMMMYLGRNIKYPTAASKKNVSGTVLISFEVGKHGNISKPEVVKGLGYGLDDEAVRVVWNMPKWIPAKQNGENVAVQYTIPIQFKLENRTQGTDGHKPKED